MLKSMMRAGAATALALAACAATAQTTSLATDAAEFKDPSAALNRYFIGHYNPLGNHFCAFAIKDALVQLLDPRPPARAK